MAAASPSESRRNLHLDPAAIQERSRNVFPLPAGKSANKRATGGREPRRYEIRVRGPIGPTLMQAFPTLAAASRGQDTLLTGSLPDQSALYGVIHQLEALGLELLGIRCLPTSVRPDIVNKEPMS
jgi:hypothetical protein